MARYASMFAEERDKTIKLEMELARLEQEKENYRLFIRETEKTHEFLKWWAKRSGLSDDSIDTIFSPPAHTSPVETPNG